jgi:hypothetical protein
MRKGFRILSAGLLAFPLMQQILAAPAVRLEKKPETVVTPDPVLKETVAVTDIVEPMITERQYHLFNEGNWYLHVSGSASYFNLGKDFSRAIGQIEGLFAGQSINLPLLTLNTNFSMQSAQRIQRAPTYFLPTGNIGVGFSRGRHSFETEFAFAGVVPLNTIDGDTTMKLTEGRTCSNAELDSCPMAKLGFVNQATGQGNYDLKININENIWLISPTFYYTYSFPKFKFGRLSLGGGGGVVFLSAKQQLTFSAKRNDIQPSASVASQPYQSRGIEGVAQSTAISDPGPIFRVFIGFQPPKFKNIQSTLRIGASYGFVNLHRDVDGSGSVVLGDTLTASFPTTSLGFSGKDTTRFEMFGVFIQAGILL